MSTEDPQRDDDTAIGNMLDGGGSVPPIAPSRWPAQSHLDLGSQSFRLSAGENVLGRDRSVDVHLDAAAVSRRHARITVHPSEILLEDLGSKNGTFVDDRPVRGTMRIYDGDVIRIGNTWLVLHSPLRRADDRNSH